MGCYTASSWLWGLGTCKTQKVSLKPLQSTYFFIPPSYFAQNFPRGRQDFLSECLACRLARAPRKIRQRSSQFELLSSSPWGKSLQAKLSARAKSFESLRTSRLKGKRSWTRLEFSLKMRKQCACSRASSLLKVSWRDCSFYTGPPENTKSPRRPRKWTWSQRSRYLSWDSWGT